MLQHTLLVSIRLRKRERRVSLRVSVRVFFCSRLVEVPLQQIDVQEAEAVLARQASELPLFAADEYLKRV